MFAHDGYLTSFSNITTSYPMPPIRTFRASGVMASPKGSGVRNGVRFTMRLSRDSRTTRR